MSSVSIGARPRVGLQVLGLVGAAGVTLAVLLGMTALVARPPSAAGPTPTPRSFLVDRVHPAPDLRLIEAGGAPFSLASMRGEGALVFFGYTHCPDVCPATIGIVGQVLDQVGPGLEAVFVSVDPERDTPTWLAEYVRYIPKGFRAVTGSAGEVRVAADAWGVRYARVDTDTPGEYSMSHTADVYLVDQQGLLRAVFPFGTQREEMAATVQQVLATPAATVYPASPGATVPATTVPTATPAPTATPGTSLVLPTPTPAVAGRVTVEIVSSSVWAGGSSPVILALYDDKGRIDDLTARVGVQLLGLDGAASGASRAAVAVQPPGVADVSWVATVDIPSSGWWRLAVTLARSGSGASGEARVLALDPGGTARLGSAAPTVPTPTLADVGGNIKAITTDPAPDPRLYQTSTTDALAAGRPLVLVVDSNRFKTSPACGKAIVLARFMLDRWPTVPIIHLEPFAYTLVSDSPVIVGSLENPTLVPAADAWGVGPAPWGPTSMPWVFVVDDHGTVRARYQGIVGSADIDVMLALIAAGG